MWKITFIYRGYVVAVIYRETDETQKQAIDSASMGLVSKYTKVRAERV